MIIKVRGRVREELGIIRWMDGFSFHLSQTGVLISYMPCLLQMNVTNDLQSCPISSTLDIWHGGWGDWGGDQREQARQVEAAC